MITNLLKTAIAVCMVVPGLLPSIAKAQVSLLDAPLAFTNEVAEPLSWDACVRLAAMRNPALVAAREQVAAAEAGVRVARSAMYPQFALGASADHTERDSVSSPNDVSYGASVNVEQSLYSGGRNQSAWRAAQATRDGVVAQATATSASITYDLRDAFVELLHAQDQTALLLEIEKRRQNNQELVELRYEGGREHKGSLALSEATLYDAQTQVKQARRHVQVVSEVLQRTIGLPAGETVIAVAGDLDSLSAVNGSGNIGETVDAVAMRTPAYRRALAAQANAAAQVESASSGNRPKISLTGSAGRTGNEDAFDEDQWSVGLKLSFPFWSGGRDAYERVQAGANLRAADAALADTLNVQSSTLTELRVSVQDAEEFVAVQKQYVSAAVLRAEIARQQYEDGLLSFENWDLIENDLINKRKGLLASERSAQLAAASLQKSLGHSVFDNGGIQEETD